MHICVKSPELSRLCWYLCHSYTDSLPLGLIYIYLKFSISSIELMFEVLYLFHRTNIVLFIMSYTTLTPTIQSKAQCKSHQGGSRAQ